MSYLSVVELSRPGWLAPTLVPVADLEATWAINEPGRLSCTVPYAALPTARDLKGLWVWWQHPTQGGWGGYVEADPIDTARGRELSCVGFAALLGTRRGPWRDRPVRGTPGQLALVALRASQSSERLWLTRVEADTVGLLLEQDWRGETVLRILDNLVSASGQEWRMTVSDDRSITLEWRVRAGRDARSRVLLAEGYQVASARWDQTIATVVNDRLAVSGEAGRERRLIVVDRESVLTYGRRQDTQRYDALALPSGLRSAARRDVRLLAQPAGPLTVRLRAAEGIGLYLREGDWCRVWLAGARAPLDFRVRSRSVSIRDGSVELAGDAWLEGTWP